MPTQLNILCLVPDQFRFDMLGCAGNPLVETPHLDRLAREGVRFNRAYTIQPMCMATRATWWTGRTPRGHGVRCNGIPLDRSIPTMPQALARAGWRTHGIGKLHFNLWLPNEHYNLDKLDPAEWPEAVPLWQRGTITELPTPYYGLQSVDFLCGNGHNTWGGYRRWLTERDPEGFNKFAPPPDAFSSVEQSPESTWRCELPPELHYTSWAAECAERFLDDVAREGEPFFLWHSIPDPHPPYTVAEPYFSMYPPGDIPEPVRREGELDDLPPHYRQLYEHGLMSAGRIAPTKVDRDTERRVASVALGMVTQWDAMVGRILDKLDETGLRENTVVIFMGDHGQMLGDHWMHSMPPSHLDGNARVPCIWSVPGGLRGQVSQAPVSHLDFVPTVLDLCGLEPPEGPTPHEPEAPRQRPTLPGRSMKGLLDGSVDSIQESVIIENDADYLGLRQRTLVTCRWHITAYTGQAWGELFDLDNDPNQLHNLWDDPEHRTTRQDLLATMQDRFAETDSTLPRRLGHA